MLTYDGVSRQVMSMTAKARNYLGENSVQEAEILLKRANNIINSYEEGTGEDVGGIRKHLGRVEKLVREERK